MLMATRSLSTSFDSTPTVRNHSSGKNGNAPCFLDLAFPTVAAMQSREKISTRAMHPTAARKTATKSAKTARRSSLILSAPTVHARPILVRELAARHWPSWCAAPPGAVSTARLAPAISAATAPATAPAISPAISPATSPVADHRLISHPSLRIGCQTLEGAVSTAPWPRRAGSGCNESNNTSGKNGNHQAARTLSSMSSIRYTQHEAVASRPASPASERTG
jgi:hypothetical protein